MRRLTSSPPSESLVYRVLAESFPHITAGVLLTKREELVPPLIALICIHPEKKVLYIIRLSLVSPQDQFSSQTLFSLFGSLSHLLMMSPAMPIHSPFKQMRDELTRQLFTLIKKPEEAQRKVIIDGCLCVAQLVGPKRTGEEMLPLCWEQV